MWFLELIINICGPHWMATLSTKNLWPPSWSTFPQNLGYSLEASCAKAQVSYLHWETGGVGPEGPHTSMKHWTSGGWEWESEKAYASLTSEWVMQGCGQGLSLEMGENELLAAASTRSPTWCSLVVGVREERLGLVSVILECPFQSTQEGKPG